MHFLIERLEGCGHRLRCLAAEEETAAVATIATASAIGRRVQIHW